MVKDIEPNFLLIEVPFVTSFNTKNNSIKFSRYCVVLPAGDFVEVFLALVDVPTLSGMAHDV